MFPIPIVIISFNRPAHLKLVWERIEQLQPATVLSISDGPSCDADRDLISACRQIVQPSWPARLIAIHRAENLGCRSNIIQGLSEAFNEFSELIVLEDDCVPTADFFEYCKLMLERYSTEKRVFAISGNNQFADRFRPEQQGNYLFSRYFSSWGWAAWRRSWQACHWNEFPTWETLEQNLKDSCLRPGTAKFFQRVLSDPGKFLIEANIWDYQAAVTGLAQGGLTVIPSKNLIRNIGLKSGSHFSRQIIRWKISEPGTLEFPLKEPALLKPDDTYDALFEKRHLDSNRVMRVLRRVLLG